MANQSNIYVRAKSKTSPDEAKVYFRPALLNIAAGLLTILVNIFTTQSDKLSIMALTIFIVTGITFLLFLILFLKFKFWKL